MCYDGRVVVTLRFNDKNKISSHGFLLLFSKPEQEPENKREIAWQLKREPRKRLVNWFSDGTPPGPQTMKNGESYKFHI